MEIPDGSMLRGKIAIECTVVFPKLATGLNLMWKWIVGLLLCVPFQVLAETYLCVAEAGVGIESDIEKDGSRKFTPGIYNVSNKKYIHTNVSGSWLVKELGSDVILFDYCDESLHCERSEGYIGFFERGGSDNTFTILLTLGDMINGSMTLTTALAEGRCSKIQ